MSEEAKSAAYVQPVDVLAVGQKVKNVTDLLSQQVLPQDWLSMVEKPADYEAIITYQRLRLTIVGQLVLGVTEEAQAISPDMLHYFEGRRSMLVSQLQVETQKIAALWSQIQAAHQERLKAPNKSEERNRFIEMQTRKMQALAAQIAAVEDPRSKK